MGLGNVQKNIKKKASGWKNIDFQIDVIPAARFAVVFDDVFGNVRASDGIGDLADDCVRGAVDV